MIPQIAISSIPTAEHFKSCARNLTMAPHQLVQSTGHVPGLGVVPCNQWRQHGRSPGHRVVYGWEDSQWIQVKAA
ncbi:hypothetical protein DPMN_034367 [Dreissena polymorpha]|uniref:Uncharacterized protein n=1 Tax=Dreissena polymorpha TaxID=45954 RepID=A0A9D4M7F7_DREPO|nr:hypothetical protein DPMN_034367 [Dreissena polymorpha]